MSTTKIWVPGQLQYEGPNAAIVREEYATVADMKAMSELSLNEGCQAVVLENKKLYRFSQDNSVDATTGKWREIVDFTPADKQSLETLKTTAGNLDNTYLKKSETPFAVEETTDKLKFKYNNQVVFEWAKVKDSFLRNAVIRDKQGGGKEVVLTVGFDGGTTQDLVLDITELFNIYQAGTGLQLSDGTFSLTAEYQALPGKVTALEGRPNWKLGFTKNGRKLPVQHEDNKLYVETDPIPEVPVVSTTQNGLMTPEILSKIDNVIAGYVVVYEDEFNAVKADDNVADIMIHVKKNGSVDLNGGRDATEMSKFRKNLIAKDKRY